MSRNVLLSNSSSDSLGCSNFRNNQPGSIETFQTPLNVTVSPDIPDSSQPLYIFIKSYLVLAALTALNHLGRQQCFQQMTAASPATTQITAAVNPKFNDNEHADGHVSATTTKGNRKLLENCKSAWHRNFRPIPGIYYVISMTHDQGSYSPKHIRVLATL